MTYHYEDSSPGQVFLGRGRTTETGVVTVARSSWDTSRRNTATRPLRCAPGTPDAAMDLFAAHRLHALDVLIEGDERDRVGQL